MKICFITSGLDINSGWERYSRSLLLALTKRGIKFKIAISKVKGDLDNFRPEAKLFLRTFADNKLRPFFLPLDIIRLLFFGRDSDIFQVTVEPYVILTYFLVWFRPYILTAHGTYAVSLLVNSRLRFFYKRAFKRARAIICVSSFTKKQLTHYLGTDRNLFVINNGVDIDKFKSQIIDTPKESGYQTILSVGALKKRKGYHISIPAVARVKKEYPQIKYIIVGKPQSREYFEELRLAVKHHNLCENVIFRWGISDEELIHLYLQADLFLLTPVNIGPSFEGFGLVYMEAAACGLPVVGTFNCGAEDAIINNKTGFLVVQNDVEMTAQAILKILSNSKLSREFGRNGKAFALRQSWSEVARKYQELYEKVKG